MLPGLHRPMFPKASVAPTLLAKSQQLTSGGDDTTITKTTHTPAVGTTYLVVAVGWGKNASRSISSVTYGGVAMTLLAGIDDNTDSPGCGVAFYGLASPASSGTIVATFSAGVDGGVLWALDLKDVATSGTVNTSGTSIVAGTGAKSLSLNTNRKTLMLGMRCVNRVTSSFTPGTGVTEEYDVQHGAGGVGTYFLGSRVSNAAENFSFACTVAATANGDAMAAIALSGT